MERGRGRKIEGSPGGGSFFVGWGATRKHGRIDAKRGEMIVVVQIGVIGKEVASVKENRGEANQRNGTKS